MNETETSSESDRMARYLVFATLLSLTISPILPATETVVQSERGIPIVHRADVVVVGGSVSAVSAAVEAAEQGSQVILVAPRTYLGDDLAGTMRLWLEEDEQATSELIKAIFGDRRVATPMRVKQSLEKALLDAGVEFLLASMPTDALVNRSGQPAGVVIANRAGRQAIVAKVVIDCTDRAIVARRAGAVNLAWNDGTHLCSRVVLGGKPSSAVEPVRAIPADIEGKDLFYYEYQAELDLGDGSFPAIAAAEQKFRDRTYRTGQLRAAERFTYLPPDRIYGQRIASDWDANEPPAIEHFRPAGVDRFYILSRSADVPDVFALRMTRPTDAESLGKIIGLAAAEEAATLAPPSDVSVRAAKAKPSTVRGDIREVLTGLRPTDRDLPTANSAATNVPVLASVDVLVVGGGTSGACAAIGAARQGASVLVLEFQEGLGGVGTVGMIGRAYHGRDAGFTREVPFCTKSFTCEDKMEWFRKTVRDASGKIWLGVLGCGALVDDGRACGAVVTTRGGRGVVRARVVIDATGAGDVAVAAGAASIYGGDDGEIALQGTGLPLRPLGGFYVNSDYLLVDEADAVDTWRALVGTRLAASASAFDIGPFIQTRERRRVVGDHRLTYLDQIAGRTYADSIVLSGSDYDSHGYPSEPYFALIPHTEATKKKNHPAPGGTCFTPYRCLLPRGLDGILVTGLAISMHRDASAMVRMQKDMHNQGYAAGLAASQAVENDVVPREIDVRKLQRKLVDAGNLPESVLTDVDSFPLPTDVLKAAVARFADPIQTRAVRCISLAVILSHREQTLPLLQKAFAEARGDARLEYAKLLGFYRERSVVPVLIDALEEIDAWDAKIFQGNMAEYAHLPTPIDAIILSLGYTGDRRATPAILAKLEMLDADVTLSHHRAVALALLWLADPSARKPLARLLQKEGMSGHAMTELEPLHNQRRDLRRRTGPLREIILARALYHCGDHEGLGEHILQQYTKDVRGLFARYATAVLEGDGP